MRPEQSEGPELTTRPTHESSRPVGDGNNKEGLEPRRTPAPKRQKGPTDQQVTTRWNGMSAGAPELFVVTTCTSVEKSNCVR